MVILEVIKRDWKRNMSIKGKFMVRVFRIAAYIRRGNRIVLLLGIPYLIIYRIWQEWILGVEIPPLTKIGHGLVIDHGQGIVINNKVVIGNNCRLRQGVTIGNRRSDDVYSCPQIGHDVDIGANAVILGRIKIGNGAMVGAGAVVLSDVPSGNLAVGNPATMKPIAATGRKTAQNEGLGLGSKNMPSLPLSP
jgi:putative colanic acid biosynthesis acetyltransferase WcaB